MIVQEEGKINEVYREGNIWYNTVQQSSMEEEKQ
jgi:(2Fe-2S) ferredoxin